jgi:hypothetical protein
LTTDFKRIDADLSFLSQLKNEAPMRER